MQHLLANLLALFFTGSFRFFTLLEFDEFDDVPALAIFRDLHI